jgi:predicted dehydrogenase
MEHWHPNPDFFFKPGGGPVLDLGPYYISNLVHLIGPVVRVAAMSSIPSPERKITSKPRHGEMITVETPTTVHAVLEFANGALITLGASWDVKAHGHRPMELYGAEASLIVPDPNFFGGAVELIGPGGVAADIPAWNHPLGISNQQHGEGMMANYRTAGLADMAIAISENRAQRCSLEFALHVVDVMTAILHSGQTGQFITLTTSCEQPAPLGIADAAELLV